MPYGRFRPRFRPVGRRKARYLWVRSFENNVAPVQGPSVNSNDLLAVYKQTQFAGGNFNFPDIVIWRIHIRISIHWRFSVAAATANTGSNISMFVDSRLQTLLNPVTQPYDERYLMWYEAFAADAAEGTLALGTIDTTSDHLLVKEFDVKSHRKINTPDETLWLTIVGTGNTTLVDYAFQQSTLLRLP